MLASKRQKPRDLSNAEAFKVPAADSKCYHFAIPLLAVIILEL
jgi:hypothetical protein